MRHIIANAAMLLFLLPWKLEIKNPIFIHPVQLSAKPQLILALFFLELCIVHVLKHQGRTISGKSVLSIHFRVMWLKDRFITTHQGPMYVDENTEE